MQRSDYRPGEYILFEGEQPPGLFFVLRGRCSHTMAMEHLLNQMLPAAAEA